MNLNRISGMFLLCIVLSMSHVIAASPYDIDGNGVVDLGDLAIIGLHLNELAISCSKCDMDGNGEVDIRDMTIGGQHFGEITPSPTPTPTPNSSVPLGYTLKWNDEFTYLATTTPLSNPDFANKWFLSSSICDYNMTPANVALDGNNVVFKATGSGGSGSGILSECTNNGQTKPNSLVFTYGYLEVRAKLGDTNQIRGIVSDIWLNGANNWPPEIDITESGSGPVNTDGGADQMNMDLWYGTGSDSPRSVNINDANGNPVDLSKDFHIYGMEWTPTFVRYLLDDVELFRVTTSSQIPSSPMYFNASIYPGGWWGTDYSHIAFPIYMYVDYVRLYQK